MKVLTFKWNGPSSLADELSMPLSYLSVEWADHAKVSQVTLRRQGGTGIRIHSAMHDVAERREIGVLHFSFVTDTFEEESFDLNGAFQQTITPAKLVIQESGTEGESGIVLKAHNGHELVIVASSFPYFLYVGGVHGLKQSVVPEYSLDEYRRCDLS